jgi:hypothetical protein
MAGVTKLPQASCPAIGAPLAQRFPKGRVRHNLVDMLKEKFKQAGSIDCGVMMLFVAFA